MSNCRNIYFIVVTLLYSLTACNPLKKATGFNEETGVTSHLFQNIDADSIWVYKTKFITKYVENRNALEFALLNENQLDNAVRYLNVEGQEQDVYLFRLVKNGRPGGFMYASARYVIARAKTHEGFDTLGLKCIGFGPAYKGTYSKPKQAIYFNELWKVDKEDEKYTLEKVKKTNLIFSLESPIGTRDEPVSVDRIALDENNKIAGSRPVVFPVQDLLHLEALEFNYHSTIKMKENASQEN
jgi:hypothetical protein